MRPSEALELISDLRDAFPSAKVPVQTVKVYAKAIQDLDYEQARDAVYAVIGESKFFPSVSEIRGRVRNGQLALPPAEEAWSQVLEAIGRVGMYRSPKFDHEVTAYALSTIGWKHLCQMPTDQLGFARSQFLKAYESGRERLMRGDSPAQLVERTNHHALAGVHEESQRGHGEAKRIGEFVKETKLLTE